MYKSKSEYINSLYPNKINSWAVVCTLTNNLKDFSPSLSVLEVEFFSFLFECTFLPESRIEEFYNIALNISFVNSFHPDYQAILRKRCGIGVNPVVQFEYNENSAFCKFVKSTYAVKVLDMLIDVIANDLNPLKEVYSDEVSSQYGLDYYNILILILKQFKFCVQFQQANNFKTLNEESFRFYNFLLMLRRSSLH